MRMMLIPTTTTTTTNNNNNNNNNLIHAIRLYSQDIGVEFDIEKCAMLVRKSGKRHRTGGMELPNQDKIRTLAENQT